MRARLLPLALILLAACAREEPPPGALPDNRPPRVTEIEPADGSVVPDFDGSLRIRYNEPIQENRGVQRELRASPADRYRVTFGFSEIRIRPREAGWRPDAVYSFRISSSISDILGNRGEEPLEVVFSTGAPITDTRVEGTIRDRVTGERVRDARALFYRVQGDSVPYSVVQDTADRFVMRALPPDEYRAWAFRDLNANMRLEKRLEPYDSATFTLPDSVATAEVEFEIVEPDSTAPILASASALDSLRLELRFDDPLDPGQAFEARRVSVRDTARDVGWPVEEVALTEAGIREAPPDTGAAAPPDTGAAADTAARRDTAPAGLAAARADTAPRPSQSAFVRLGRALEPGTVYEVRADSFMNLRKLYGGGDTTVVYEPPDPDTVPGDTAPADTVSPDTVLRDTMPPDPAPSDTSPADTLPGGGSRP